MIVGGERFPAESLSAVLVDAAVDQAAERFGEKPHHIVLTHPGGWGSFRRDLLRRALAEAGFPRAALVASPVAALHAYLAPHGDVTAGVCEFGPDGAVVTIAAATAVNGWQPIKTLEGVDPAEAVARSSSSRTAPASRPSRWRASCSAARHPRFPAGHRAPSSRRATRC